MKKQFLILFAFISVLALSQVPQRFNKVVVTGDITSPKFIKTGSTVDSVLLGNGSSRSVNSLKTDTVSLSNRINLKENLLPSTPSNPESRFLNGNKQWAEIVLGSGGYASNVYFTNLTSTIVGSYKQTSGTHELTETIASGTCNNNEVLIHTYLFEQPVGITTIDAGVWRFTMNSKISSNVGDSKFKIVQFRRSSTGVETDMFTIYSNTIENTDYQNFIIETVQPSFLVDSLDRFGCRIYATTTTTVNKIISYKVGDGFASYLNTPLALRHSQLRDKNGESTYQHLTSAQVTKVNNTSGINTGDETTATIKTKLGAASSSNSGYLVNTDWAKFNTSYTSRIQSVESPLYFTAGTIGSGYASSNSNGLLSSTDWGTFNGKQNALGSNQTTALSNLTGINFNTVPKSTAGGYANSLITDDGTTVSVSGNLTATNLTATNTGDETLTSIKTKLGAASSVSDGYLTYNMFNIFNGKEPSFTKNTAFNKNFGTTAGTVLEGRTFGTAASSGVGDFIQNSTGLQIGNYNISGVGTHGQTVIAGTGYGFQNENFLLAQNNPIWAFSTATNYGIGYLQNDPISDAIQFYFGDISNPKHRFTGMGNVIHSGTVNALGFLLNGNNLTSSLTTNYITKWNGGSLVNAIAGTDYQLPITLTTNGTSGAATFENGVMNVPNYGNAATSGTYVPALTNYSNIASSSAFESMYMHIGNMYSLSIKASIVPSVAGSCALRIALPQGNYRAGVFSVTSPSGDQSTVLSSFTYTAGGADYVGVVVNAPSTDAVTLTVTGMYTYQ